MELWEQLLLGVLGLGVLIWLAATLDRRVAQRRLGLARGLVDAADPQGRLRV